MTPKRCQYVGAMILCIFLFAGHGFADDIYVTGVTNITMRTGPGVEHKIVAMLQSGTKLEIVEYQTDWSQVKTDQGKIGWVLSRFLTKKVPDALLVEKLEKENQELVTRLAALEAENQELTVKNGALVEIEEQYVKLRKESADFLKLDAMYKEMIEQNAAQKKRIEKLENDLNNETNVWFLIGPGVFIIGLIFGLSTRKRRKSSLL